MRRLFLIILSCIWVGCGESARQSEPTPPASDIKPVSPAPLSDTVDTAMSGTWVLSELPQAVTPIDKLYPRQRPNIFIQPLSRLISGSTGCNRFSATLTATGNNLKLSDLTRSTLICIGDAEPTFLKALENATRYYFRNNDELVLGTDSLTWMVLKRR